MLAQKPVPQNILLFIAELLEKPSATSSKILSNQLHSQTLTFWPPSFHDWNPNTPKEGPFSMVEGENFGFADDRQLKSSKDCVVNPFSLPHIHCIIPQTPYLTHC